MKKFQNLVREKPLIKRGMLSVLYNLFDPLGCLAPFTLKPKLLLQLLIRKKVGWDELRPEEEREQWVKWLKDVPKLSEIKMDRCYKPKRFGNASVVQLHMFSDASRVGFASVGVTKHWNGTERNGIYQNKPEYAGIKRNNTRTKRSEQEWF